MQRKKPGVDIILDILTETLAANTTSTFVSSLLHQYQERGGLSKKQLEGLYHKASKVNGIAPAKMATLQAIILKKVVKERSPVSQVQTHLLKKDENSGKLIESILEKYPQHKRVLFFKAQFDSNEHLSVSETDELKRFYKLLL
jgi:hypothetical protein